MFLRKHVLRQYDLTGLSEEEFQTVMTGLALLAKSENGEGKSTARSLLHRIESDNTEVRLSAENILERTSAELRRGELQPSGETIVPAEDEAVSGEDPRPRARPSAGIEGVFRRKSR